MLILPLIDLLILSGTGMLVIGFMLKVTALATTYRPSIFGFTSLDFVLLTAICWGFALTLAARSWVRLNEPRLMAARREAMLARARAQAQDADYEYDVNGDPLHRVESAPPKAAAGGERH